LLGDEVSAKAIKITYKGTVITAKAVCELINIYLKGTEKQTYGKQSLKKLNRKDKALDSIPIMNQDLKGLQKELKKYGVDYSVRKSLSEKNSYDVYFKGTDITQIQNALKNYTARSFEKRERPSIKERMVAAVQKAKAQNESLNQHEKRFERGRDER